LVAWVRDLIAESLASLNVRAISTGPSPVLAIAVARPASTTRAAAWGVDGVGLAAPAPGGRAWLVDVQDLHAGSLQVAA
jgi:hypothetical protein